MVKSALYSGSNKEFLSRAEACPSERNGSEKPPNCVANTSQAGRRGNKAHVLERAAVWGSR